MNYKMILFDLDDTLYNGNSGLWNAIKINICRYMTEKLGIPENEVVSLRERLLAQYGTTMRGLAELYEFDIVEYMSYVHNIPLEEFLAPNEPLREMLQKYTVKKHIFTNANADHAQRVMNILGIRDLFEDPIVDVTSTYPLCKPMPAAFDLARQFTGDLPAEQIVFIDDSLANIQSAKDIGFQVIWVNKKDESVDNINFPVIEDILQLEQALPLPNGYSG
jgi:pyrimidine 5'-nucleotidase